MFNKNMSYTPLQPTVSRIPHTTIALWTSLALLMLTAALELTLISSTVYYLDSTAKNTVTILSSSTSTFRLVSTPAHLLVNQGHTSNGAAGTAFVLVGLVGILVLKLSRQRGWYAAWLVITVLSSFLSTVALVYTFVLTGVHAGQHIDVELASMVLYRQGPKYVKYALGKWTPENWFGAVLELDLADSGVRDDVWRHLMVMRGWRWNLVPLVVLGWVVVGLAFVERRRRVDGRGRNKVVV